MTILVCDRCGEECGTITEDALDWCHTCGLVEGNTHLEVSKP